MKNFEYVENSDIVNVAIGFFLCVFIGLLFSYSMVWAIEKEIQLGIHGKSSESLINGRNNHK